MKKVKPAEKFVSKEKPGASVSVNSVTILVQYSEEISNWEKSVMLFEIGKLRKVGKDLMIRVGVESVTGLSDGAGVVDYLVNNALLGGVTDDERNVLLYLTENGHASGEMSEDSRKVHERLNRSFDRVSLMEGKDRNNVSVEELIEG